MYLGPLLAQYPGGIFARLKEPSSMGDCPLLLKKSHKVAAGVNKKVHL